MTEQQINNEENVSSIKKYYLETNALYSLSKIKEQFIPESFTSVFALFELISGIGEETFAKRKAIMQLVRDRRLHVNWDMPEQIIFSSFDIADHFKFYDYRLEALGRLITNIRDLKSLEEIIADDARSDNGMGLKYFRDLDSNFSRTFVDATVKGNKQLKELFGRNENPEPFVLGGKEYTINSHDALKNLLTSDFGFSVMMCINGFVSKFYSSEMKEAGITEEMFYNSYNSLADRFMIAYATNGNIQITERRTPQANDFTDLLHLAYLSVNDVVKIVSDDGIYSRVCPDFRISVASLK